MKLCNYRSIYSVFKILCYCILTVITLLTYRFPVFVPLIKRHQQELVTWKVYFHCHSRI